MDDYYSILGIDRNATEKEIKDAYRKLAMKHHPDRGGNEEEFKKINAAYEVLGSPESRDKYDNPSYTTYNNPHSGFRQASEEEMREHFADFFRAHGAQFNFRTSPPPKRNKDLRIRLIVDLPSILEEQTRHCSVQTLNGHRDVVEVKLPRGVQTGMMFKFVGLGDNSLADIDRGDLYVQVEVERHPLFEPHGIDLYTMVNINCLDAITGMEVELKSLDDKTFSLTIPPGIQDKTKLRIGGQGLWAMNGSQRGNLFVIVNVVVPKLDTTQIELVKELKEKLNPTQVDNQ